MASRTMLVRVFVLLPVSQEQGLRAPQSQLNLCQKS